MFLCVSSNDFNEKFVKSANGIMVLSISIGLRFSFQTSPYSQIQSFFLQSKRVNFRISLIINSKEFFFSNPCSNFSSSKIFEFLFFNFLSSSPHKNPNRHPKVLFFLTESFEIFSNLPYKLSGEILYSKATPLKIKVSGACAIIFGSNPISSFG